jgi:hypothetical protein
VGVGSSFTIYLRPARGFDVTGGIV